MCLLRIVKCATDEQNDCQLLLHCHCEAMLYTFNGHFHIHSRSAIALIRCVQMT